MIDFINVNDVSMAYILKSSNEGYVYNLVEGSLKVSPDKDTIRATLQIEKNREDIDPFDIIVMKKDDEYWIKSDYFVDPSELSRVDVYRGDDSSYILLYQFQDEIMYLHIYCD